MKKIINIFASSFPVLTTLILIFVWTEFSQGGQEFKEIMVTGKIYAFSWDEDSVLTSVLIFVEKHDENRIPYIEEYFIYGDEKGKQLFELIGDTVEVTGVVDPKDVFKQIHVKKHKIIMEKDLL
jgi:hypothetical protein